MRTIKYALLGMLYRQNMTGYELMKFFEGALSEFWSVKHSQIYPELRRLTEEGMVTFTVEISGTVLERKLYAITEAGRQDFLAWIKKPMPIKPTPKDEFRLRLFYASALGEAEQKELICAQKALYEKRLAHLRDNQAVFGGVPPKGTDAFNDYLVLLGAIRREEATIRWLEECLTMYE